ncbi:MAG TPA: BTAD domain-containing putative transcriptional regulator [Acidimicrobiales bacterium]|jgi:DNA-binding SARP family transcriptional activator|nr:BTAD domain-containing putative transcriptional regulator [Acidimicrobiales bacterium]
MAPVVEFRVLGPLEVVRDGAVLELGGRKQRALLAILLIHAGQVVSVDRLIEELWGDEAPARALASLQAYVSRLRRILQPQGERRSRNAVISTRVPGYVLAPGESSIDSHRFAALAQDALRSSERDPLRTLSALDGALGLWRGDPYAEFAYEDFAQPEIARLTELRWAAKEARLLALLRTGDHATAAAEADLLVRDAPLREGAWAALMTALYRSGRQSEALRAYQRARASLNEQLGIDPGRPLQDLERLILEQAPSLDFDTPASATAAPRRRNTSAGPRAEDEFVGRDQELTALARIVATLERGQGGVVVVTGEPGIGKSRLAAQGARMATGAKTAWGRSVEGDVSSPYWLWVTVLRGLLDGVDPGNLAPNVRDALADLRTLDASLERWSPGATPPPPLDDAELARTRLRRAIIESLTAIAAAQPIVLIVEDIQWADPASLQLLSLLAAELDRAPILIIATLRDGDRSPTTAAALHSMRRAGAFTELHLRGLAPEDVHRYAELVAAEPLEVEVTEAIAVRTSGNPLFVRELTRLLRSQRSLTAAAVGSAPVPEEVRETISRRLDRLPEQCRNLLSIAASLGRRFDVDLLSRVSLVDQDSLLDQLEGAIALGLVVEDDDVALHFEFTHDLVREVLQRALGTSRRTRLHARIATALLHDPDADNAFELAHHMLHAVPVVRASDAVRAHVAAAEAALAHFDSARATEALETCLLLLEQVDGADHRSLELAVRVRLNRALTLTHGHASDDARQQVERAVELATTEEAEGDAAQAIWAAALSAGVAADFSGAIAAGQQLLARAAASGDPAVHVLGHTAVCAFAWCTGDTTTSITHANLAVQLLDEGASVADIDPEVATGVHARANQALAAWFAGDEGAAVDAIADALHRGERAADQAPLVFAHAFDAWLAVLRGDLQHARRRADQVLRQAREFDYPQFTLFILNRPGSDGGSGYWIPTPAGSACWAA